MKYHITKSVSNQDFPLLREKVITALKEEGFGVLTEIDIQATMKKKLDKDYLPFVILGACNPVFADKVLSIDPNMSALLPCNVSLRKLDSGEIEISAIDPIAAMSNLGNPAIEPLATEVRKKLENVVASVQ
ncbi:DUF302 domain-containing protein [Cecembia lonarensis]|uniref:DUF302 domain-containing protein n=1 Tax=Cecembia lonarensis (strain CCUG 58316 / KCTC 22772 / LW9) TaxID=1225176 RepID=K1LJI8_CECL9|nr:DUF302 domain-containing protein [Cecembia lonarensis]EKB50498.1 hypothetical protein B879_00880 [Cecembia lonarensis LW9]